MISEKTFLFNSNVTKRAVRNKVSFVQMPRETFKIFESLLSKSHMEIKKERIMYN